MRGLLLFEQSLLLSGAAFSLAPPDTVRAASTTVRDDRAGVRRSRRIGSGQRLGYENLTL